MNIHPYQDSDQFRNQPGWFSVSLLANHPELKLVMPSAPSPSDTMRKWLESHCTDDVYFSYYEPVRPNGDKTVSHFVVDIWFSDANEAMLFKLTWGGV